MQLFLLFSTMVGCGSTITESDFLVEYPQEMCARIFSCVSEEYQETIENDYGSQEQCATDMQADIEASLEGQELEYNATTGSECLTHLRSIECDEEEPEVDPCANVYTQVN